MRRNMGKFGNNTHKKMCFHIVLLLKIESIRNSMPLSVYKGKKKKK